MTDTKAPTPDPGQATTPPVDEYQPTRRTDSGVKPANPGGPVGGLGGGSARPRAHSMADMLVGTTLADRYKLLRKLGEGAMGWVFLAEHTELGKRSAVKVLRPSLCRLPEAVSRFRREARAATQIGSKHIVDVTDFGTTTNGAVFLVMEHLKGEDLGRLLKTSGKLPWERVHQILLQLCEALQTAHDADIIHRDVKPANFFRIDTDDDTDFIKVLDFGIARLTSPKDSIVTATGVVMGTPDFMAPEQAQGRHVDHRADIYSLGASAYALLTGRPPFVGANEYDVIYKQLNEDPKPPSEMASQSNIPPWMDAAILRSMSKDPEDRFQSMAEFGAALQSQGAHDAVAHRVVVAHDSTQTSGPASTPVPLAPAQAVRHEPGPAWPKVVAAGAVAVVAVATVLYFVFVA